MLELRLPERFSTCNTSARASVLGAFLASFLFIRTSARLIRSPPVPWWPGRVKTAGGLHLHHLVWGIVLLLITGFSGFTVTPSSPWIELLGALFGVGAGLTLDEFALWIHLRDVYWSEEGRVSVDAVIVATVLGGLILCGLAPFDRSHHAAALETLIALVLLDVALAALAALKGGGCSQWPVSLSRLPRSSGPYGSPRPGRPGRDGATSRGAASWRGHNADGRPGG